MLFLLIFFTPFSLNAFHQNGIIDHTYLVGWILFFCSRLFLDKDHRLVNIIGLSLVYGQSFCSYFFYGPTIAIAIFTFLAIKTTGFPALTALLTWRNTACMVLLLSPMTLLNIALFQESRDAHLPVRTVSAEDPFVDNSLTTQALPSVSNFLVELSDFTSYAAVATIRDVVYMFFPSVHEKLGINFSEVAIAFPFFFLVLFIVGITLGSCRQKRLMGWFCGIFLLLSLGTKGGLFSLLHVVPGFSFFRHSEQLFTYYTIGVMYFIVLGFHTIWQSFSRLPKRHGIQKFMSGIKVLPGLLYIARLTTPVLLAIILLILVIYFEDRGIAHSIFPTYFIASLVLFAFFRTTFRSPKSGFYTRRLTIAIFTISISAVVYVSLDPSSANQLILTGESILSWNGISTLLNLVFVWILINGLFYLGSAKETDRPIRHQPDVLWGLISSLSLTTFLHIVLFLAAVLFVLQQLEFLFFLLNRPYFLSHQYMHDGSSAFAKRVYFLLLLSFALIFISYFWVARRGAQHALTRSGWSLAFPRTFVLAFAFTALWSAAFYIGLNQESIVIIYAIFNLIIAFPLVSSVLLRTFIRPSILKLSSEGKTRHQIDLRAPSAVEPGKVFFGIFAIVSNVFWILAPGDNIPEAISGHLHYSQQLFWSLFLVASGPIFIAGLIRFITRVHPGFSELARVAFLLLYGLSCFAIVDNHRSFIEREFSSKLDGAVVSKSSKQRVLTVDGFIPWESSYWNITPQVVRYPELILRQYTAIDTYDRPGYIPAGNYNLSSYTSQPMFVHRDYRELLDLELSPHELEILFQVGKPLAEVYSPSLQLEHEADVIASLAETNSIDDMKDQVFIHRSPSVSSFGSAKTDCPDGSSSFDENAKPSTQGASLITNVLVNSIVIENNARASGFLLVKFTYSKHWRATVDGEPRALSRANGVFFGLPINCSDRLVQLTYNPVIAKLAVFFYISIPILGGVWILYLLRRQVTARLRSSLL